MTHLPYFAYGSNIDLIAFGEYLTRNGCNPDDIVNPRRAILDGYRIRTNYLRTSQTGAANIQPENGSRVEGVLMEITPAVHRSLRRKEGWPHRYREIMVFVTIPRTRRICVALTYVVRKAHRLPIDMPVRKDYRDLILNGARDSGFTKRYQRVLSKVLQAG